MGGYGAVISAGGAVTQLAIDYPWGAPHKTLAIHQNPNSTFKSPVPRIKTVIAFAPWGMNHGVWDQSTLTGVKVPMLLVAGSVDDVSGYEKGIRAIWKGITNMDNYLNLEVNSNDGIWSKDETGQPKADHSHWIGFKNRTAKGLRFETLNSGN
jgi:hypothetical protein